MANFKNKTVIITGAAMGLGFATAREIAKSEGDLVLVDYNEDVLNKAENELAAAFAGVRILKIVADVSNEEAVRGYVDEAVNEFGAIYGFYNNAGIEGKQALLTEYDISIFKKVIEINLMGVYYGLRYVLPVMKKNGGGRVVNTSSVGGIRGVLNQTAYVAAKHAVAGLTKNAALEYGKNNILTNAIAPGAILTPMVAEAFREINPGDPKSAEKEYASHNPTRRLGLPEEVGKLAAFLLSDDNGYVNGQIIAIDGGESNMYGNP